MEAEHAFRTEAGIDSLQAQVASHEQSGAGQQQHRQGDLAGHQDLLRPNPAAIAGRASAFRLEDVVRRGPARLNRRNQPAQQTRGKGNKECERQSAPVQANLFEPRQSFRPDRHQRVHRAIGEQKAGQPAQQREQHAFRQQLPQQASVRGAHRAANR